MKERTHLCGQFIGGRNQKKNFFFSSRKAPPHLLDHGANFPNVRVNALLFSDQMVEILQNIVNFVLGLVDNEPNGLFWIAEP